MIETLKLPSGVTVEDPKGRLLRFCEAEYIYYDAAPVGAPNTIEPIDVLATVAVNSRLDTAEKIRVAHRGLVATCPTARPRPTSGGPKLLKAST